MTEQALQLQQIDLPELTVALQTLQERPDFSQRLRFEPMKDGSGNQWLVQDDAEDGPLAVGAIRQTDGNELRLTMGVPMELAEAEKDVNGSFAAPERNFLTVSYDAKGTISEVQLGTLTPSRKLNRDTMLGFIEMVTRRNVTGIPTDASISLGDRERIQVRLAEQFAARLAYMVAGTDDGRRELINRSLLQLMRKISFAEIMKDANITNLHDTERFNDAIELFLNTVVSVERDELPAFSRGAELDDQTYHIEGEVTIDGEKLARQYGNLFAFWKIPVHSEREDNFSHGYFVDRFADEKNGDGYIVNYWHNNRFFYSVWFPQTLTIEALSPRGIGFLRNARPPEPVSQS